MIKKLLLLVAAVTMTAATACAEVPTPTAVTKFYNGMKKLTRIYSSSEASELETQMLQCFNDWRDSGIDLPNDFKFFSYDEGSITHKNKTLPSQNYLAKLRDYAFLDRVLKINIKIMESKSEGRIPDFRSGNISSSEGYINTLVVKTFKLNGKEWTYNDTVSTNAITGLIENISNGYGVINKNILRIKAAQAYEKQYYSEAYRLYEQIISIDPKDADAYYRLGLMTYWMQGCENKFRKKEYAHDKGIEYMSLALNNGYGEKAKRAYIYMKYPNQY